MCILGLGRDARENEYKKHASPQEVLDAKKLEHGDASVNMNFVASYWSLYLQRKGVNIELTAKDVCNLMILFKVNRSCVNPDLEDNHIDIGGYSQEYRNLGGADK